MGKYTIKDDKIRRRNIAFVDTYKIDHPCQVCGESRPPCLDFHHAKGDKDSGINKLVWRAKGIQKLKFEISKCIGACANCHRMIHADDKKKRGQTASPILPQEAL